MVVSSKIMKNIKSRLYYTFSCWLGYCPTSSEIENIKVKELSNKLKSTSFKETLTNILEWQDRNLVFWIERYPLSTVLGVLTALSVIVFILFLWLNIQFLRDATIVLGTSTITTFGIIILYICYYRRLPITQFLKIFSGSLPINWVLENKFVVCRDYAKLTSCLLSNIFPDAELYFVHAQNHVATGIMIENRVYVLDQHLPVLTVDKWNLRDNIIKIQKIKQNNLESVKIKSILSIINYPKIDTEKLVCEMTKLLNLKKQTDNLKESVLEIKPWRKGVLLYEDNEIVNYSLASRLKMNILNEGVQLRQVTRLEIVPDKDDLEFKIFFRSF